MTQHTPTENGSASVRGDWKRMFLRGLALLLPTVLTVLILVKAYQFIDTYLIQYVNSEVYGIGALLKRVGFYEVFTPKMYSGWLLRNLVITPIWWFFHYAFGFVLSMLFVCAVGLLIGTLVGRRAWHAVESRLMRFPVIRFVYPFIRQVTDFVFSERRLAFRSVVVVEYPRKGLWSIGFLTGTSFPSLQKAIPQRLVSVLVPTSPTPMTGYLVFVPEEDIIRLDITVDEAFRLVISGGVIRPSDRAIVVGVAGEAGRGGTGTS
ncbi:MAG TPA: DUF502 domain-containing protein [Planctomycetota bacterium]|nr:DUF502 domain-containing protein [Planctomycetota bacterium]